MLRSLVKTGQKTDGQQIQKTLGQSRPSVFGLAPGSGAVIHSDFADSVSVGGGQDRDKPMHFAVQFDVIKNLSPVDLEATVVIVEFDPGQPADQFVEHFRRQGFADRIVANFFPTADQIVLICPSFPAAWGLRWDRPEDPHPS